MTRMEKQLPETVKVRTPNEKLIWLYIDRWPGEHSARSLHDALGLAADRALPALVRDGLLIEEVAPAGSQPGRYRAAVVETDTPPRRIPRKSKFPRE